jgi:hypothetical protein
MLRRPSDLMDVQIGHNSRCAPKSSQTPFFAFGPGTVVAGLRQLECLDSRFAEKADIGQPVVPELSSARCYGSSTSESGNGADES